jgi:hypothetical protein
MKFNILLLNEDKQLVVNAKVLKIVKHEYKEKKKEFISFLL